MPTVPIHAAADPQLPFALDATVVLALGFGVFLLVAYDFYRLTAGDGAWP